MKVHYVNKNTFFHFDIFFFSVIGKSFATNPDSRILINILACHAEISRANSSVLYWALLWTKKRNKNKRHPFCSAECGKSVF